MWLLILVKIYYVLKIDVEVKEVQLSQKNLKFLNTHVRFLVFESIYLIKYKFNLNEIFFSKKIMAMSIT